MLIGWGSDWDLSTVDGQLLVTQLILWIMTALAFIIVIFAILTLRQSLRMTTVLPTPITPAIKLIAWGYLIFCIIVLGTAVNYLVL